ncbi:hypothetical protein R5W23_002700 [Gemmata sp. JC673]|uniref:HEAT repeat domain-containing protein n=1 Tax=Gemmata algarum TaxID=2975278 RepID=A0ABU5F3U5_9BACT|nr:hypothetical protein [Gemmata algarum]MDY3561422.1 hypothetical protein [Gemmata algarum]
MTLTTRDTRTSYRRPVGAAAGSQQHKQEVAAERSTPAREGAAERTLFWRLVRNLILASHRDRTVARSKVVDYLKATRYPGPAFNELLFQCSKEGGPDGLDIAIDVIAEVGPEAARYARRLLSIDSPKWDPPGLRRQVTDSIWYAILRGVCQSKADVAEKIILTLTAALRGTVGIREAAAHALGDLAECEGPRVKDVVTYFLGELAGEDQQPEVRQAATEVLSALED